LQSEGVKMYEVFYSCELKTERVEFIKVPGKYFYVGNEENEK